jgi:hypothetical protein
MENQNQTQTEQSETLINDALAIIEQVCAKFVGNLSDHQAIQKALAVIKNKIENK